MKKLLLSSSLLLLMISTSYSQENKLDWAAQIGGTGDDDIRSMVVDKDKNTYITGTFLNTVDFDPGTGVYNLTSNGGQDIFIQKLDSNGKLLWAHALGGTQNEYFGHISLSPGGNLIVTGGFKGTVDFDPRTTNTYSLTAVGGIDIFVLQMNKSGSLAWAVKVGSNGNEFSSKLISDVSNNIYVTGYFKNTVDFNPQPNRTNNLTSNGKYDIFYLKLNSTGNYLWAKSIGGVQDDFCTSLSLDQENNLISSGKFKGTVDFDPNSLNAFNLMAGSDFDAFVHKMDKNGNFIWAKSFGSDSSDYIIGSTVDENSNIYSVGGFRDTVDFDPDTISSFKLVSNGNVDAFIQKLDSNGNFLWAKSYGGSSHVIGSAVTLDSKNDIYTRGTFLGIANFNTDSGLVLNKAANGSYDNYIQKITKNGDFEWVEVFGGIGTENISGLSIGKDGGIYVAGNFESTIDIDTTNTISFTSNGFSDGYILKLEQCGYYTDSIKPIVCNSYLSPSGKLWTQSGIYLDTLFNSSGCDKLYSINLSIVNFDTSLTIDNHVKLTANDTLSSYQWIECTTGPISGDTNRSFIATANGTYAVELTNNGCVDTSACVTILSVGLDKSKPHTSTLDFYPNPNNGIFSISISNDLLAKTYQIFDVKGSLIREAQFTSNRTSVDLSAFGKGVYFLHIREEGIRKKLVVY